MEHLSTKLQGLRPLIMIGLVALVYGLSVNKNRKVRPKLGPYLIYSEPHPLAKAFPNRRFYLTPPFSHQHTWISQEYAARCGDWHTKSECMHICAVAG